MVCKQQERKSGFLHITAVEVMKSSWKKAFQRGSLIDLCKISLLLPPETKELFMQVLSPSSSCDLDRQFGKFKVVIVGVTLCQSSLPVHSAKLKAQLQLTYSLGKRTNKKAASGNKLTQWNMNSCELCV